MGCCSSTSGADAAPPPAEQQDRAGGDKREQKKSSGPSGSGVSDRDVDVQLTETGPKRRPQSNINEDYQIQKRIGRGNYSTVHLAVNKRTRKKVAVKIAYKAQLTQEDIDAVYVEVEVLRRLDHPNVVKLLAFYESRDRFYLVMELLTGGELLERLLQRSVYTEAEARTLMTTLFKAIAYCHSQGVVHRDLKLENVLLATTADDAPVKIADFGFAKRFESFQELTTSCGTPGYVAPEILSSHAKWYGPGVDIWSLGVMMYILLVGYPPFTADSQAHLFRKIKAGQYSLETEGWELVSNEAKDLVRKLLELDPEVRFTPKQALQHPWLSAELQSTDLEATRKGMASYLARRRLKRAVHVVRAANTLKRTMGVDATATTTPKAAAAGDGTGDGASDGVSAGAGAGAGAGTAGGDGDGDGDESKTDGGVEE